MRISLVMCTRNRASSLGRALESAAAMRVPDGLSWEFVLVDNGSTDETPVVVESFADRLPIRRVVEPMAGLSNARNRGVAEARGEYICWTDDDVTIDPEWLSAYAGAFDRHPEAAFFGGVIEPVLEGETPKWFVENRPALAGLLAERDFGREPIALTKEDNTLPYGANYAVRTSDQRRHLYDPQLGVSPQHKRLGEETAVVLSLLDAGGTGVWVPKSRVQHIIPHSRQTLEYLSVYQRSTGETWAYLTTLPVDNFMGSPLPAGANQMLGAPRWLWREAVKHGALYRIRRSIGSANWFNHWCRYAFYRGAIGYFRLNDNA